MFYFIILIYPSLQDQCLDQFKLCTPQYCKIEDCEYLVQEPTSLYYAELSFNKVLILLDNKQSDSDSLKIASLSFIMSNTEIQPNNYINQTGSLILNIESNSLNISNSKFIEISQMIIEVKSLEVNDSNLTSNNLFIYSELIILQSTTLQAMEYKCKGQSCNCESGLCDMSEMNQYSSFIEYPSKNLFLNYTLGLQSEEIYFYSSNLSASNIGIYGSIQLDQDSSIFSSGQGCEAQKGFGCGFNDWIVGSKLKCGSSGASHGSQGNAPYSAQSDFNEICHQLIPRGIYGNPFDPIFEGSGGGGMYFGGDGGGIIYIKGKNHKINGLVLAEGIPSQREDSSHYGSGSGGSIQIRGTCVGKGLVSTSGGKSNSISGDGGGGRIFIEDGKHTLNCRASSIISSYCPPLYGRNDQPNCQLCEPGQYSFMIGHMRCSQCVNFNANVLSYKQSIKPYCEISGCKEPLQLHDGQCISQSQRFISLFGGENVIFGASLFLFLLIIQVIVVVFRNRKNRKNRKLMATEINSQLVDSQIVSDTSKFVVEDLPYHVLRIYVMGNNTLFHPWHLAENTIIQNNNIQELISYFNMKAKYTKYQQYLLLISRYFYYPIYYEIMKIIQRQKFHTLTNLIRYYQKLGDYNLKITNSFDYTLAFIDLVDYNKNVLDWNKNTQFPVTLVLSGKGTFLYPWQINVKDPLVKSLQLSFQKQKIFDYTDDESQDEAEEDSIDEITSFDEFIQKFNKFSLQIDTRKSMAEFIKNCYGLFEFIDDANNEVFNRKSILLDVCFHILSGAQSYIIMLSTRKMGDLQQTLRELHQILNFRPEYQIKVSVNFDQTNENAARYFDNQIVVNTLNDLNEQISIYHHYEDDKEELNNLKIQMQRKIEADGILTPLIEDKSDFIVTQSQGYQQQQQTSQYLLRLKRVASITFSFFVRYRSKQNDKGLTLQLIFLCLISLSLNVVYPLFLLSEFADDKQNLSITLWIEVALQLLIYPISWIVTPILLMIWLINPSKNHFGKRFLLFNFCAMINTLTILIIGMVQIGIAFIEEYSYIIKLGYTLKIYMFIHCVLQGIVGTQYLQD